MSKATQRLETLAKQIAHPTSSAASSSSSSSSPSSSSATHSHLTMEAERKEQAPANVLITGAAGQIAYSLIFMVLNGNMLGKHRKINLHLLDIPPMVEALNGVVMEIQDCAFPLLNELVATTDYREAFTGVEFALLVGARPRGPGMERKDLLKANAEIFKGQGEAMNQFAHRNCKVVVVGNPANTNALICQHYAPNLPRENFTALTRLDHNRAKAQIAMRARTSVDSVHNVIIWGNHSSTQYPDVNHAHVAGGHNKTPVRQLLNDNEWLNGDFITTVQQRGAAIIKARKLSSAASAANAIIDHMRDWILGTPEGEIVSMAVPSDGSYGIPEGVIYSYPVTCRNGTYSIVQGLSIDEFSRQKMQATHEELLQEKALAFE